MKLNIFCFCVLILLCFGLSLQLNSDDIFDQSGSLKSLSKDVYTDKTLSAEQRSFLSSAVFNVADKECRVRLGLSEETTVKRNRSSVRVFAEAFPSLVSRVSIVGSSEGLGSDHGLGQTKVGVFFMNSMSQAATVEWVGKTRTNAILREVQFDFEDEFSSHYHLVLRDVDGDHVFQGVIKSPSDKSNVFFPADEIRREK